MMCRPPGHCCRPILPPSPHGFITAFNHRTSLARSQTPRHSNSIQIDHGECSNKCFTINYPQTKQQLSLSLVVFNVCQHQHQQPRRTRSERGARTVGRTEKAHGTGGRRERPSSARGDSEQGGAARTAAADAQRTRPRERSGGQRRRVGGRVGGGAGETGGGGA